MPHIKYIFAQTDVVYLTNFDGLIKSSIIFDFSIQSIGKTLQILNDML